MDELQRCAAVSRSSLGPTQPSLVVKMPRRSSISDHAALAASGFQPPEDLLDRAGRRANEVEIVARRGQAKGSIQCRGCNIPETRCAEQLVGQAWLFQTL